MTIRTHLILVDIERLSWKKTFFTEITVLQKFHQKLLFQKAIIWIIIQALPYQVDLTPIILLWLTHFLVIKINH